MGKCGVACSHGCSIGTVFLSFGILFPFVSDVFYPSFSLLVEGVYTPGSHFRKHYTVCMKEKEGQSLHACAFLGVMRDIGGDDLASLR